MEPCAEPAPDAVVVRVAAARLDVDPRRLAELEASLTRDERARAARFVAERHRRRFAAARGLLRRFLSEALGCGPAEVRFRYGAQGKPALAQEMASDLRFNVSHTQDHALFAWARGVELGLDIEEVRASVDHAAISRRYFSPAERDALSALPEAARARGFFVLWTRKEAYIKARGGGLSIPLDSFDVSLDDDARLLRAAADPGAPARFALLSLRAPEGFVAALCVEAPRIELREETSPNLGPDAISQRPV